MLLEESVLDVEIKEKGKKKKHRIMPKLRERLHRHLKPREEQEKTV